MKLELIQPRFANPQSLASNSDKGYSDPALELEQQELPEGYKPPVGIDLIAEELENKGYLP